MRFRLPVPSLSGSSEEFRLTRRSGKLGRIPDNYKQRFGRVVDLRKDLPFHHVQTATLPRGQSQKLAGPGKKNTVLHVQ